MYTQKQSVVDVPAEVLRRFGGLTMRQKRELYYRYQSLQFVFIPDFLKPQISTIDALERFGVCQMPGPTGQFQADYFVCPSTPQSGTGTVEEEKRFCCGSVSKQYCCTATEFIAGIRVISPAQRVSPSIIIGTSLAFLLLSTLLTIICYAKIARNLRKQSSRMQSNPVSDSYYALQQEYGSKQSFTPSHVPPTKQLMSHRNRLATTVVKEAKDSPVSWLKSTPSDVANTKSEQPPALRSLYVNSPKNHPKQSVAARHTRRQGYKS